MIPSRMDVYWLMRWEGYPPQIAASFSGAKPEIDRLKGEEVRAFHAMQEHFVEEHPEECPHGIAPPHKRWEFKCRLKMSRPTPSPVYV